jgi:hypothetical protein
MGLPLHGRLEVNFKTGSQNVIEHDASNRELNGSYADL